MDSNSVARKASELPDRFAARISADHARLLHRIAGGGEWPELMDNLVASLRQSQAPVTAAERDELANLLTACEMPTDQLTELNVS